jgi:hypothetical protein
MRYRWLGFGSLLICGFILLASPGEAGGDGFRIKPPPGGNDIEAMPWEDPTTSHASSLPSDLISRTVNQQDVPIELKADLDLTLEPGTNKLIQFAQMIISILSEQGRLR